VFSRALLSAPPVLTPQSLHKHWHFVRRALKAVLAGAAIAEKDLAQHVTRKTAAKPRRKANRRANRERAQAENAERHLAAVLKRRYARAVRIITAACASRQLSPEELEAIAEKIKSGEIS